VKIADKCGILQVARELGIEVKDFSETTIVSAPEDFFHKRFTVAKDVVDHDVIINLPKFKTHAMMGLTLAVKNLYGLFVGKQKVRWHLQSGRNHKHFARLLIELAYSINPGLTILDAVTVMEGNGPGNGTPRNLGFIAASADMLSLDVVAAEIAGVKKQKVPVFQVAEEMGFSTDLENIEIKGSSPDSLKIDDLKMASTMNIDGPVLVRPLVWLLGKCMTVSPFVNKDLCEQCGICITACPAGCIAQPSGNMPVEIESSQCIRCFCCQELCPHGAINARDSVGVRLLKKFRLE
jgi:NAD-dependent dihydropyrimidine dehydrogenase PreA subunit